MRPSGELIAGTLLRLLLAAGGVVGVLVFWPAGVALIGLALFMPWPDAPDWVTPEPEAEAEEAQPQKEAFWMWNR